MGKDSDFETFLKTIVRDYLAADDPAATPETDFVQEDDLIIGVRQLMNDYYAKDIGNKIRHGYREKQKEGLVVKPPFGYWKDRNTGRIRLHPEASVTVQIIYGLYCEGLGQKEITRRLNTMQ